ncbi:MAG TPA: aldo/keto reductase [Candidatus Baltobacteraceae bacterium]
MTTMSAAAAGTIRLGDRTVKRLGYGAMRLTGPGVWGPPKDPANALAVLRRALELGVTIIDTSDAYGPETSELQIAEALYPYPPELVIATKGGLTRPGPSQWVPDCRPERLRACCEASLKRLRAEAIDLYQLHAVDPKVPYAEQVGVLEDLRREGKIRLVGVCNVGVDELDVARSVAPIVSVQNRYNMTDRSSEDVLEICEREGLAFLPWFPLDAGDIGESAPAQEIARAHGCSVYAVALAWLLKRSESMLPIPGTSSIEHLEENVAAARLELSDEEFRKLAA